MNKSRLKPGDIVKICTCDMCKDNGYLKEMFREKNIKDPYKTYGVILSYKDRMNAEPSYQVEFQGYPGSNIELSEGELVKVKV